MAGESPQGVAASPDGAAKKDLSNEQLKAYIHKARAKIRKLEEQNKASAVDAGERERRGSSVAPACRATVRVVDHGLCVLASLSPLRVYVVM